MAGSAVTGMLVAVELVVLLVAERRRPLRAWREPSEVRLPRNGVLAAQAVAAASLLETPVVLAVAAAIERRGWGLLPRLRLPPALRTVAALASLDYAMYAWHAATHRIPVLWRLHLVHHVDRDSDVTTALRIHACEIAVSVAARALQVAVLGVTPGDFTRWQRFFACSVLFHHANLRLPEGWERVLGALIVTPRLHGIHHLARRDAQHGNWSSGLVLWDRLHGTLRAGDPSGEVGVPAYRADADVSLARVLALPFVPQPDPWRPG